MSPVYYEDFDFQKCLWGHEVLVEMRHRVICTWHWNGFLHQYQLVMNENGLRFVFFDCLDLSKPAAENHHRITTVARAYSKSKLKNLIAAKAHTFVDEQLAT